MIDDGLDVLHSAFLDEAGKTRILRVWDQTTEPDELTDEVAFGRLYKAAEIDDFIAEGERPRALSAAHGTAVASIAAGRASPEASNDPNSFQGGVAPDARIVFVKPKVEEATGQGGAVGSSFAQMAALEFVASVAREHGVPFVANLSFGTHVGGHDGSSLLENFIDTLTSNGATPGRIVVKSAGNEQDKESQALLDLSPGSRRFLTWNARTVGRDRDLIDLWFSSADLFTFRIIPPERDEADASDEASIDNPKVEGPLANGNTLRMAYERLTPENGDSRLNIQIRPGDRDRIEGGDWQLEITSAERLPAGGAIHAWIERDDTRPLKFRDSPPQASAITIPGTARSVLTVGAAMKSSVLTPWKPSSRGPTRDGRNKPDLSAPGAMINAARAGTPHAAIAKSGTSFAAPHVTGAVALLISHQQRSGTRLFNAIQMQTLLTQSAKGFDGRWSTDTGYGLLDVEAALKRI